MKDYFHLVCPYCRVLNRVPAPRLNDGPQCGQCHVPLFAGQPIALTAANLDLHLSRSDIPLVVDFWASWCGPCQVMAPAYRQAANILEPQVRLGKVNAEEERSLASRFQIVSIPTLIVMQSGRELARQRGVMEIQDIVQWVRSYVEDS